MPGKEVPRPLLASGEDIFQEPIYSTRSPLPDVHQFMAVDNSEPQTGAKQVRLVASYYRRTMRALGWYLLYQSPPGRGAEGDPSGAVHVGQYWRKRHLGVGIGISNWSSSVRPPEMSGWRVNVLVIISDQWGAFPDSRPLRRV